MVGWEVYNNESPLTGWDGRKDNQLLPPDVYIFYIQYQISNGEVLDQAGDLTMVY